MNSHRLVEILLETHNPAARAMRDKIEAAIEQIRKRNPAGYAQLITTPYWPVPAYSYDDPDNAWWTSEEAAERLQQFRQAAQEGPKPPTPDEKYRKSMPYLDAWHKRQDMEVEKQRKYQIGPRPGDADYGDPYV